MKPINSKLHGLNYDEQKKIMMNGPRPTPLMIRKPNNNSSHKQHKRVIPIIIYTQSPKIIHTKPQDFMALVQSLTGVSSNQILPRQQEVCENFESSFSDGSNNNKEEKILMQHDGDETSSTISSSVFKGGVNRNIFEDKQHSPCNNMMNFVDMPLFTPTYDLLCSSSSRQVYKFSDSPYGILGSLISPSGLGFIKDLPEY